MGLQILLYLNELNMEDNFWRTLYRRNAERCFRHIMSSHCIFCCFCGILCVFWGCVGFLDKSK